MINNIIIAPSLTNPMTVYKYNEFKTNKMNNIIIAASLEIPITLYQYNDKKVRIRRINSYMNRYKLMNDEQIRKEKKIMFDYLSVYLHPNQLITLMFSELCLIFEDVKTIENINYLTHKKGNKKFLKIIMNDPLLKILKWLK
jgi:hypothetical protein